ncbi:MAG: Hsp20/alpha crystallin family protein [Patescibacteria group bacterium]
MTLLRKFDPFEEFIKKFFEDEFYSLPLPLISRSSSVKVDVYDEGKNLVVEVEAPGFKKENLKLSLEENYLKVEGKLEETEEVKDRNYWRKESRRSSFVRVIPLPVEVDQQNVKASFKDGVLRVVLPKKEEPEKPGKEIKIE